MHYATAIINNLNDLPFAWLFMERVKLPVHAALDIGNFGTFEGYSDQEFIIVYSGVYPILLNIMHV